MAEKRIAVRQYSGSAVPVRGNDIDTDRIIPARFMKCVTFDGLGQYAFYDVRYDAAGKPLAHPFNDARFAKGSVLVVNQNFGCGSSREHAPQALQKHGIGALIGESFAEIFAGNCTAMGIPAVRAAAASVQALQELVEREPATQVAIDLEQGRVEARLPGTKPTDKPALAFECSMPAAARNSLVDGSWDSTGVLLENDQLISATAKRLPYVGSWA